MNDYNSCYQSKMEGKDKGSGVALYIHNAFNYTELSDVSCCTKNLESIFVEITNTSTPITTGVIYRPPSGNINLFLDELDAIMSKLPDNKTFILGDFNIDLLDTTDKNTQSFEDIIITSGFTPLISIHTHQKPNCRKTCIDNILTNTCETVKASGTIENGMYHHNPIFQISSIKTSQADKNDEKTTIFYDYSKKNVGKFCAFLERNSNVMASCKDFPKFNEFYQFAIDNTCKLEKPKITKRTSIRTRSEKVGQIGHFWVTFFCVLF